MIEMERGMEIASFVTASNCVVFDVQLSGLN